MKVQFLTIIACLAFFGMIYPLNISKAFEAKSVKTTADNFNEIKAGKSSGKFALLVGINSYQDSTMSKLNGCENDVKLIKDLLTRQYKFQDNSDVKTLLTKAATRTAIIDNFKKQLIENAKSYYQENKLDKTKRNQGATVVFYYSGHGSTLPDLDESGEKLSGEEPDGLDETIVPYDAKLDGTNAIIDDEFDKFYGELNQWTTNVVFIFDSCHSGTATRATNKVRRTEFEYELPKALKNEIEARKISDENLTDGMDDLKRTQESVGYVTVSGCLPNQLSQEGETINEKGERQTHGFLTYNLVKQLSINPTGSYREIMPLVQKAVQRQNPYQIPQYEGDVDQPFFNVETGSNNRKLPKEIAFTKTEDMTVKLEAGKVVGALEGGVVAIYSKKARALEGDDDQIGSGIIQKADEFSSTAKIKLTDKSLKEIPSDAKITLVTPFFGTAKRLIAFDSAGGQDLLKKIQDETKKESFAEVVDLKNTRTSKGAADWDASVVRMSYADFKIGNKQARTKDASALKDDEQIYALTGKDGIPLYNFYVRANDENAATKITGAIEKHVRVENIRAFGNGTGGINDQLKLELVPITAERADPSTGVCAVKEISDAERVNKNNTEILNPGERFYLKIANNTGQDLYIYVYDIAPDGGVSLIYPDPRRNLDEKLQDKIEIKTYGKNQCFVYGITMPEKTAAPYGIETFKLIATTAPINGRILESPAIARGERNGSSPLSRLLVQASTNETRSGIVEGLEFSGWATTSLNIEVREK